MQVLFFVLYFAVLSFAKVRMEQHVLAPVSTRYSIVHVQSTSHIATVTVQPTGNVYHNSTPTKNAASVDETGESGSSKLRLCYPIAAGGDPDWSAPCRARQKLIFECQFTGKSTISEEEWSSILHADAEPPSVANSTQQQCLCGSANFWDETQQCHECLNSIGMPQPTAASAISIISSGFCSPSQTAEVDDYMAHAKFTQTVGAPTATQSLSRNTDHAFASFATGNAQTANMAGFSAHANRPTTKDLPSSLQYSQDMPGWNPSTTTRSATRAATGTATSIIHSPAKTTKYVVGTPTASPTQASIGSTTASGNSKNGAGILSFPSALHRFVVFACVVTFLWA
ncbi:MAG: hypothetical protein M1828_001967 [Chrysothrix sp. TS-e1954]|nr:MAG: hypothetical protein M1828_001967 [Chrysothrix sp. TS-e1954]